MEAVADWEVCVILVVGGDVNALGDGSNEAEVADADAEASKVMLKV
jgi:hypothetical protein